MEIKQQEIKSRGIRFSIDVGGKEVGRAFLYLIHNDLRKEPYALIEDVFVDESERGKGLATKLLKEVIEEAKKIGCYKLVVTSRHERSEAHTLYENLGFKNFGLEYKMYLSK